MSKLAKFFKEFTINAILVYIGITFIDFPSLIPGGELLIVCTIAAIFIIVRYFISYVKSKFK